MSIIRARAPLRLGIAGGGTDLSPYCDRFGGYVINVTIDRYAHVVIKLLDRPVVRFVATDLQVALEKSTSEELVLNGTLDLHKAVYKHMIENFNGGNRISMEVTTLCDAPMGSGLGSSSTIVVAMVKAFSKLLDINLSKKDIAKLAYRIERIDCGYQGGRQDHYSASFGGFNFMEFYADDKVIINPIPISNWAKLELETSLILYFTGVSRHSSLIIEDQTNSIKTGLTEELNAMHRIKAEALAMKECLLSGDFRGIVLSMNRGWEMKKRSSAKVSNLEINKLYQEALNSGALAGKVSGAGGGGFMWFFVPPEFKMDLARNLSAFGGQVSNCNFTEHGAQAWKIG